ncbi:MAG: C1 family peptidase [Clostridia bacterium]|jgi:C1A family cysteine protease|nr:C1 family peptidase [Clostridia bacterium]
MKTIIIGIALIGAFFANIICKIKKSFSKKNRHVYTLQKDPEDERDFKFCVSAPVQLPDKVDLSNKCSPIVNQGTLNSCTANAIGSGMFEYMWIKAGNVIKNFSRLFLYYNERNMEGTVKQDCGAYIRDGMKTLCNDGICTEPSWPYIIRKFSKKPDNICYEEAVNYKILSYNRVQGQNQIKQCLAQGNCIVAGIWVYESFESQEVASTGMVPMPESTEKNLGGHAVLIVGYDDTVQRFKLRNSWGNGWGDKGYFYIPYLVFDKLVMDMWTASDIA